MYAHPGQEAAVHGQRVRAVARVEPRSQPRLAPARRSGARRRCGATCRRSQLASTRASRRCTRCDFDPAGFRWIDCNDNENSVVSIVRYARDRARLRRDGLQLHAGAARTATGSACPTPATTRAAEQRRALYGGSNVGNGGGVDDRADRRARLRRSRWLTVPPLGCLLLAPMRARLLATPCSAGLRRRDPQSRLGGRAAAPASGPDPAAVTRPCGSTRRPRIGVTKRALGRTRGTPNNRVQVASCRIRVTNGHRSGSISSIRVDARDRDDRA